MKTLILLITAIVFSSNCYAVLHVNNDAKPKEEIDRDKYYYYCQADLLVVDKLTCKNLKKGDLLSTQSTGVALLYCDTEFQVISYLLNQKDGPTQYECFYNGRPIKELLHIE
jgi:hypothetical protein|tara:strand:- start:263 stop:598 length:336 start_codon:yes stop_codon:yes gene_type:complete